LAGAAIAAWVTLFLEGAISVMRGCLEEGVGCSIARDLKGIVSSISIKAPNAVGNVVGYLLNRNQSDN